MKGKAYLVGAGPGDPGLITVKGLRCVQEADVIVYDRLMDSGILSHAKEKAELIDVGKVASRHTLPQPEINALLVARALEGKVVVRLKGGDPFVFGRGGEEAEALAEAGVPFEVVPGVTSAIAVPAYAGIPVTHRDFTSTFAIITGHEDPTKDTSNIAWDKIATGAGTLVFLMGMSNLPQIVAQLTKNGRSPKTPIALIRWGTFAQQETLEGTLEDIVDKVREADFGPPVVMIVGEVVKLREKLRWFDNRPLFGKRVLVTRSRTQASALSELLAQHGAMPIELPTIEIVPMTNGPLTDAIDGLREYAWIIFTSANGVDVFFRGLSEHGRDVRALGQARLCTIGPGTAAALERYNLRPDYMPEEYIAEGIVEGLQAMGLRGQRVLVPRADQARPELISGLAQAGAEVQEVITYRSASPASLPSEAKELLLQGKIDIVTFTSSSTVKNLAALLGDEFPVVNQATIACIGPITAQTARELGLRVDVEAQEHTIPGLVEALVEYYANYTH